MTTGKDNTIKLTLSDDESTKKRYVRSVEIRWIDCQFCEGTGELMVYDIYTAEHTGFIICPFCKGQKGHTVYLNETVSEVEGDA